MLERPGELVTREEIRHKLWPDGTFVDFEHSINTAVKKLRAVLGDDPEKPCYIQTVPRHGYRLLAPVEPVVRLSPPAVERRSQTAATVAGVVREPPLRWARRRALSLGMVTFGLVALVAVAAYLARRHYRPQPQTPTGKVMLVVLPFENLSGDPEQEYFSDGMTEEMTTQPGRLSPERLGVIGRVSAMTYRGEKKRIDEIGKELGVQYVVEGSVRRASDRVRIAAQLIRVGDQTQVWAQSYERDLNDVLSVQREVAEEILREIRVTVGPQGRARDARARPVKPEAMDVYLKGVYLWRQGRPDSEEAAIGALLRAIEIQPDFAMAYVRLADAYDWMVDFGPEKARRQELQQRSSAAVSKALELDDTLSEAHSRLGINLLAWDWDWAGAERELTLALVELNPNEAFAHYRYALWLDVMGRYEDAITEHRRAIELDPLALHFRYGPVMTYTFARRYDEEIKYCQEAVSMNPADARFHAWLSEAYALKGEYESALAELQKWRGLRNPPPPPGMYEANLAELEALAGSKDKARRILLGNWALITKLPDDFGALAVICATVGFKSEALLALEKGYEDRELGVPLYVRGHPGFDSLCSDPRFQDLLRRMNFPP